MGPDLLGWAAAGMLAGAGAVGIGWLRAARLWPTRASLARRVDELERAFPAWQAEMVRLATTASDQYAQSKVERERAQAQHAGVERARKAKQQEIEDPEAAFRAHVAQLPPEQRARAQREHEKARIAARFG